ncbi:hypothetical protein KCU81_g3172, partial [Aureobasidium melanogenum]|uniref:Endoplasmic reticulum lectin n=1 Tax=Aureobasidium melanogenum (strain CBS 110374) TaxID=1043003 RepID=A0A074WHA2_AURM1
MKSFWALPAVLRAAVAAQNSFSVQDDVLAFPQFSVDFPEGHVSSLQAQEKLDPSTSDSNFDLSHRDTNPQDSDKPQYHYEELVLANQHYLCQIPRLLDQPPSSQPNETLSKQDHEKELARANTRGWQLLKGMQGNCIYYWSGWWSYRYCYGQGVKQFHQLPSSHGVPVYPPVEDPAVPGFMLGAVQDQPRHDSQENLSEDKAVGKLETRGESRYLVQRLAGGTVCDLTGRERRIEVQFHCNPATADRISLIKEVATCAYLMVIQTPRLCNDIAFQPPQKDRANKIACSPILDQDQVPEYEAAVAAASDLLGDDIPNPLAGSQSKAPVTIGGITIGAHKWIPEGSKIEKSAIVGGTKDKFVETIADSFGKAMSADELKRLGLGDAKSVETLKKELEKIANGQGWELKVFDTPDGREYRGVLLGDEEPDSAKTKAAEVTDTKKAGTKPSDDAPSDDDRGSEGSEETYKDEL